ncbi:MAG TPA: glycosyltransferase family 4 protein [Candidatus Acidoferrales bacterium]|jgi:glycosyltransferase involved in cell wall biosynthesis|nr:glycosyltransferase family 4 protein [Candidatus Acidoferrales bacterium]
MKVLIYAIDFVPKIGGEETFLLLLAQGLVDRLGQAREEIDPSAREDSSTLKNAKVILVTRTAANGFDDSTLPYPVVREPSLAALWRMLREADVVQLSGPVLLPLLFGVLQKKPIVIQHHTYHAVCPQGLFLYGSSKTICPGHFMARRYRECLRCNAASVGWRRSFLMLLATFLRHRLTTRARANVGITRYVSQRIALPHGRTIDYGISDLLASSQMPSIHSSPASLAFAYVGRLVEEKGLRLLLDAAKQLKDEGYAFRVKFIGDGPERASLETQMAKLSLQDQVQFMGFLRGEQLESALADVSVIMMPSVWEETAGLAAIEQMMRARLVIAADIGGLGEVVGDAGLKFPAGDTRGLVARMREVLNDPGIVSELGSRARARAMEVFHKDRMIEQQFLLYQEITKDKA